jgi:hypothetical protein
MLRDRVSASRSHVTPEDLKRVPPAGGWSIGQVFEHLCVADDSYLAPMRELIGNAKPDPRAATATWRPSIMGNLLVRSFRSPRKMPTPKLYRPSPSPRPAVIEAYLERLAQTEELLQRSRQVRWQQIRLGSPVTRLIRLNLGDCFEILVTHTERHLAQVDRIKQSLR